MTFDWWTFGLQTINVLVLFWLLSRFFWRPVAGMIERRREQAQALLDDARAVRDAAAKALAEAKKRNAGFAEERELILQQARSEAAEAGRALLAQAEAEVAVLREQAAAARAKEHDEAEKAWSGRASRLAIEIAEKLVSRLDATAVREAFLQWLAEQIVALPSDARGKIVDGGGPLEITSAHVLTAEEQAHIHATIRAALGQAAGISTPEIVFRADAALIAGLELRTPHFVLNNSWRADLQRILAELQHD
ncbi:F0F1 ATP synthase subunit delta [Rhodoblastus sp.]|jgi:F-type H+-transporting ATPase subunit b|uniref:F0F1 ATP synthase subunit delta n=1 Tax=Rhodoblastus sp. TaxID=1962975 RepID=UPI0025E6A4D1|nr:F0F1 ATP synthase subunit delta [Rhodoblastus sp.]